MPARALPGGLTIFAATTLRSRGRGLGGLRTLDEHHALAIPTSAVHTFTMHFALDLIWLDREGSVIRFDRAVPRGRIRVCRRARSVIELNAGHADAFLAALAAAREGSD